jgi:hypothetical protein
VYAAASFVLIQRFLIGSVFAVVAMCDGENVLQGSKNQEMLLCLTSYW